MVCLPNEEEQLVLVLAALRVQLFQDLCYRCDELVLGQTGVLRLELLDEVRRRHRFTHQVSLDRFHYDYVAKTHQMYSYTAYLKLIQGRLQ